MTSKSSKSAVYRPFCRLSSNSMKMHFAAFTNKHLNKSWNWTPFLLWCEACFCKRTGNAATRVFQMQVIQKWLGLKYANNHEQIVKRQLYKTVLKHFAHLIKRVPKQRLNLPIFAHLEDAIGSCSWSRNSITPHFLDPSSVWRMNSTN